MVIRDVTFRAELAMTPSDRSVGLSGRDSLAPQSGMLFIFEAGVASAFWMRGMRFPLDFIWISSDCAVVDIMPNVPAPTPDTAASQLPVYATEAAATYTFEINAGESEMHGISIGDPVRFSGLPTDAAGACQMNP